MGIDQFCHTGLDLGLWISPSPSAAVRKAGAGPALTLSLSDGSRADYEHVYGQDSAGSCLSSVKRERETESRVSDEDGDGSNGRKKLRLNKAQSALLEDSFKQQSTLTPKQKRDLAKELKLRPRQVEVWFQNRRARTKLKQTEIDREFLKNCCDSLTDENRRLQKELHELKSLNLAPPPPVYMQLPATTLTMCPSCERLSGFNNQSAAC